MAQVKFSVYSNVGEEIARKLAVASSRTEEVLAQIVLADTDKFVPMDTGQLSQQAYTEGGFVIYRGPYARFLYNGKVMVDPNTGSPFAPAGGHKVVTDRDLVFKTKANPQAQSHWFEASKAVNLDKWKKAAEEEMKKNV